MVRPLRFGFVLGDGHLADPVATAQRAEQLGFDVVLLADHVGVGPSPLVAAGAIAQGTSAIRIGTLVLNAEMRNPVQVAWEAATLDRLSGGRIELGLGAGHTPQEFAATGVAFEPAARRKARLCEAVEIIRRLLDGEEVDHDGVHHRVRGARIEPAAQRRLPILVGGNGAALLGHAGAHADIIGLQGLGRTLPDGHRHTVRWGLDRLDTQLGQVRAGAGERFGELELNALVQIARITDDRASVLRSICEQVQGLPYEQAEATPYLLVGTVDEVVAQVLSARDRWGITYFAVRELDGFAPVLEALASHRAMGRS